MFHMWDIIVEKTLKFPADLLLSQLKNFKGSEIVSALIRDIIMEPDTIISEGDIYQISSCCMYIHGSRELEIIVNQNI